MDRVDWESGATGKVELQVWNGMRFDVLRRNGKGGDVARTFRGIWDLSSLCR